MRLVESKFLHLGHAPLVNARRLTSVSEIEFRRKSAYLGLGVRI